MTENGKKTICMIGTFPPPIHGEAVAFEMLAESPELTSRFRLIKVDFAAKRRLNSFLMVLYKILINLRMLRKLRTIIKKGDVDLFYLAMSASDQGCIRDYLIVKTIFKFHKKTKLVIHHHSGNFREYYESTDKKHKELIKYFLGKADLIIVLTPKLRTLFDGLIPPNKIEVVSNGIRNDNLLSEQVVREKIDLIQRGQRVHILYLSSMRRSKGYFELLQAAPELKSNGIDFEMTFAGDFRNKKDEKQFFEFILNNKLQNIVSFKGVISGSEKFKTLANHDVFVLPTSMTEGQPISILESMNAGMAVITTNRGGITDVVKDQINGIILPEITPRAIAGAIMQLYSNRDYFVKICGENMRTTKEMYMEEHYVNNMIKVFDEAINS